MHGQKNIKLICGFCPWLADYETHSNGGTQDCHFFLNDLNKSNIGDR